AMVGGKLREPGEVRTRGLRVLAEGRHRHQAGDQHGAALDEGAELGRSAPRLALLAGYVDLDEDLCPWLRMAAELLERGVTGDRVDQAAGRQQLFHLAALEVADEVPLDRKSVV